MKFLTGFATRVPTLLMYGSFAEINKIRTNARLAGLLLGLLIHCNLKYKKSVSLIGFGHGSLVIQNCLKRLASHNCGENIMNVSLVHGMLSINPNDYYDSQEITKSFNIQGNLYNIYSKQYTDYV